MKDYRGEQWNKIKSKVESLQQFLPQLKDANLVLFGAGMNGSFAYQRMKQEYKICAFSDNNANFWKKSYEGLSVIEPNQLKEIPDIFVIITVTGQYYLPIKKQLSEMKVPHMTYIEYQLASQFPQFETVYQELLEDEFSKETYQSLLISHLTCEREYLRKIFVRNQYFEIPEFSIQTEDEIFVDCGAYTGDTLERFISVKAGCLKRIYSFEPTEKTYQALCIRKERLLKEWALEEEQIITEKKIVTAKSGVEYFLKKGNGEKSNRIGIESLPESEPIIAISLDEYFAEKEEKPTFIKADIEGAEFGMLKGAEELIRSGKPLLAICIYHRIEDLYEIPILLKQFRSDYKMSIRHHMPNYYETVLYCY